MQGAAAIYFGRHRWIVGAAEATMKRNKIAGLWLLVGIGLLIGGALADRQQTLWFTAATAAFAVSVIAARRGRSGR
jgi:hypothetical protein